MLTVYDDGVFHLHNAHVSYVLHCLPNQALGHLYYGAPIQLDAQTIETLRKRESFSGGTVLFDATLPGFSLADTMQENPVYGTSDFRQGALAVEREGIPLYLHLTYQGYQHSRVKLRNLAFPGSFGDQDQVDVLTLTLRDTAHRLTVRAAYALFEDSAAVVRWQTVINDGSVPVEVTRALSASLALPSADYQFINLAGTWARERHVTTRSLAQGTVSVESQRGASSHQQNPYVALLANGGTLRRGEAYGFNLIYSGNFVTQAEVNEWQQTRVMIGIHPDQFKWRLAPGEAFTTPEAVLTYSDAGLNGLAQANATFIQAHLLPPRWRHRARPVVLNSWEAAYFDFDVAKLLTLAKAGQAVGIDCFVLDDGWFGHRDDDRTSLGDWQVYAKKFPQGIQKFSADIRSLGLQFGLWFEPEMVSPDSNLLAAHPDWVVGPPAERRSIGRNQYVLDFTNPAVVNAIFAQMQTIIEQTHLTYIKWDMNRNITEAYSPYLAAQGRPQGEFFHRYIQGVYALYARLLTSYPDLLIEGCAGGGGRFDLGIMAYSPQIWVSDDSDAIERLKIQTGTALAYPLSVMSNHVTAVPNDQVGRTTSLETRYNVAIFGALGYELDLTRLTPDTLAVIKAQIEAYKASQTLVLTGQFELLKTLDEGDHNTVAWALRDETAHQVLVGFYRIMAQPDGRAVDYLRLPFVDSTATYQLIDRDERYTGSVLQHVGVRLPYQFNGPNDAVATLRGDYQSCLMRLTAL